MYLTDIEIIAQQWIGGENGDLERCIIEVERTDQDEIRLGTAPPNDDDRQHIYIARDRALQIGHALIEQALKEWRYP